MKKENFEVVEEGWPTVGGKWAAAVDAMVDGKTISVATRDQAQAVRRAAANRGLLVEQRTRSGRVIMRLAPGAARAKGEAS